MDRKIARVLSVMTILVILLAPQVTAGIYTCWGGCYNECVIILGHSQIPNLPCTWHCLKNCLPYPGSPSSRYCNLGCSLDKCINFSIDAQKMDGCVRGCSTTCH